MKLSISKRILLLLFVYLVESPTYVIHSIVVRTSDKIKSRFSFTLNHIGGHHHSHDHSHNHAIIEPIPYANFQNISFASLKENFNIKSILTRPRIGVLVRNRYFSSFQ